MVLDALDDLGWPPYSRELMLYLKARYGRNVTATRFGTLGSDEIKAFGNRASADDSGAPTEGVRRAGPRPVWLCFGLTHDRGEAIKRLWARSDWQLERRGVGPPTQRPQHTEMRRGVGERAPG